MVAGVVFAGVALQAGGQSDVFGRPQTKTVAVEYLFPEQVTVPAGKPAPVTLHFRIAPGLHINSHAPKEEGLIPTAFSIPQGNGVRLESAIYPMSIEFALPVDPKHPLNVYTGEFAIQARVVADSGDHLVQAKLRYQACDQSQCMPPKTINVAIDVIGR